MARATVELDFFGLEKESSSASASASSSKSLFRRKKSFSSIHSAISKINPDLLKSVIGSASLPPTPAANRGLPLFRPVSESAPLTSPMTIFYNGTVVVLDLTRDKAESFLKLAAEGTPSTDPQELLFASLSGDLPIARKKSLQRFLEKRKER